MKHRAQKLASRISGIVERSHLIKFLLVGGASFAVDRALLALMHEVFGVDLWMATPIAFVASLVFNFALQRSFTCLISRPQPASPAGCRYGAPPPAS